MPSGAATRCTCSTSPKRVATSMRAVGQPVQESRLARLLVAARRSAMRRIAGRGYLRKRGCRAPGASGSRRLLGLRQEARGESEGTRVAGRRAPDAAADRRAYAYRSVRRCDVYARTAFTDTTHRSVTLSPRTLRHPHGIIAVDTEYLHPGHAAAHIIQHSGRAAFVDVGTNSLGPLPARRARRAGNRARARWTTCF